MNNKVNVIFLVNLPGPMSKHNFHDFAYRILENILCTNYHDHYNIILIRYSLVETPTNSEEKRALQLFAVSENNGLEELINFGNIKFTEPNFLGLLFCYINSRFLCKETVLFVWGHGYGVGIFKEFNKFLIASANNKFLAKDLDFPFSSPFVLPKKIKTIFSNDDPGSEGQSSKTPINDNDISDMLTITELNDSLKRGFREINGRKIKMLVFMNCDMMRFDNLYDLSFSAEYIVGPQTPISWWGYDYGSFFNYLKTTKENDLFWENACENLTKNMASLKVDEIHKENLFLENTVIAAVNSLHAKELASTLNQLLMLVVSDKDNITIWLSLFNTPDSSVIADDITDTSNSWAYDQNKELKFPGAKFDLRNFDFINLFREFSSKISTAGILKDTCEKLITAVEKLILSLHKATNYPQLNGISITYTRSLDELTSHPFFHSFMMPGSKTSDSFAYDCFWPEFVVLMNKHFDQANQ